MLKEKRKNIIIWIITILLFFPFIFGIRVYIHNNKIGKSKLRIIFLYYNISALNTNCKYNIQCNEGLEIAIRNELDKLGLNYEIKQVETSKIHLNKTFLESSAHLLFYMA